MHSQLGMVPHGSYVYMDHQLMRQPISTVNEDLVLGGLFTTTPSSVDTGARASP